MNKSQRNVASFVLRFTQDLWEDAEGAPQVRWRGHINHVQGDEEGRFTNFAEAVTFMQEGLTQLTLNAVSGNNMNQEETLRESFKFWEDFSTVYSGMMFEAMEQSLKQSESVKQQMKDAVEQSLAAWQVSAGTNSEKQLMEVIQNLQQQIDSLTTKVENLEVMVTRDTNNLV
ncbi:hypothetical protein QUF63_09085 [Anaerolineales bacterium HSG25]|nr:hypothetical protein [Anaerolineales bacterium HSG25]